MRVVVEDAGRELGTSYHVSVVSADVPRARRDLATVRELCRKLESRLSEWDDASEIARVNRVAPWRVASVDDDLRRLLVGSLHVARVTEGAFDPTWRPLGLVWDRAEAAGAVPDPQVLATAQEAVGADHVLIDVEGIRFTHASTRLGVAGFAKGWIVDALFHRLRELGYGDVLVNVGGDLRTTGRRADGSAHRINVLDPWEPTRIARTLVVEDAALATSGNYFRFREIGGRRFGHILDPRTGWPPEFDGSVTVLARDAAMADALATACFVMGPAAGMRFAREREGVDVLFVTRSGVVTTLAME